MTNSSLLKMAMHKFRVSSWKMMMFIDLTSYKPSKIVQHVVAAMYVSSQVFLGRMGEAAISASSFAGIKGRLANE